MKNSLLNLTTVLLVCFYSVSSYAGNPNRLEYDSLSCLQIEGSINNVEEAGDWGFDGECTVELISLNEVLRSVTLKEGKKKFKFVLSKNEYYAIRISRKGYITKIISVNTEMLTESDGIHKFVFGVNLLKDAAMPRLNEDIVDFPVAIIQFDYETESFSYNKEYTAYIKRELHKVKPIKSQKLNNLPVLQPQVLNTDNLVSR